MEPLICTACQTPLVSQEECKEHYKSDFHAYNLKRKLVKLLPVTSELYLQKKEELSNRPRAFTQISCSCCGRAFNSQTLYERHLAHQQHRDSQEVPDSPCDPSNSCLFCNFLSVSLSANLSHMLLSHGFFVPDIEFVTNIELLMDYLQQKVRIGLLCLYCDNRTFRSPQATQQHMLDKQHTFVNTEDDEEEFAEFYDWGGHTETDETEITHTGELKLPSGKLVGHKQYLRYYKQYYRPVPAHRELLSALAKQYSALRRPIGWKDKTGVILRFKEETDALKLTMKFQKNQPYNRDPNRFN